MAVVKVIVVFVINLVLITLAQGVLFTPESGIVMEVSIIVNLSSVCALVFHRSEDFDETKVEQKDLG